jgi:hypothetical protein
MKLHSFVVLLAVVGTLAGGAFATTIVDFESFADAQNINGVDLGGVTLSSPNNVVEIYSNRFGVSYKSPTKAFSSIAAGTANTLPITGIFSSPQSFVALWGGDAGSDTDSWQLEAFDAVSGGNSLGLVQSGSWDGDPYTQLSISSPGIMRFVATWTGQVAGVGYDDLEFSGDSVVPEPLTMLGVVMGIGAMGSYIRRRRTA